jgi:hypothetical protein
MQIVNCLAAAVTLGFASATRSFQNASIVSSPKAIPRAIVELKRDIGLSRLWLPFTAGCQQHRAAVSYASMSRLCDCGEEHRRTSKVHELWKSHLSPAHELLSAESFPDSRLPQVGDYDMQDLTRN